MADTNAWNSQQARSLRDDFYFMTALTCRVGNSLPINQTDHKKRISQTLYTTSLEIVGGFVVSLLNPPYSLVKLYLKTL